MSLRQTDRQTHTAAIHGGVQEWTASGATIGTGEICLDGGLNKIIDGQNPSGLDRGFPVQYFRQFLTRVIKARCYCIKSPQRQSLPQSLPRTEVLSPHFC